MALKITVYGERVKNVQVIDGALNTACCIYAVDDTDFRTIFPRDRDVEFVEDLVRRLGQKKASALLGKLWLHPVRKADARGIQGTLFFELLEKKPFYPTKRELEMEGLPPQFRRFQKSKRRRPSR